MYKLVAILMFSTLLVGSIGSKAFYIPPVVQSTDQTVEHAGLIHGGLETGVILLKEVMPDNSSQSDPLEEESEDEDNTSKENVVAKTTSIYLSLVLQQRFSRQNALFKELHLDTETPPPRR
ncbi:MAG: hypothetical protein ACOYXT_05150 [Bacteroidota bacterium]